MTLLLTCVSALWLGILTSVSPCPLATNVAAISLLSRNVDKRSRATMGAIAYTLGRVAIYVFLGSLLFAGLVSMPKLSEFLRSGIKPFIGPLLILTGMALIGWLPLPINLKVGSPQMAEKLSKWGIAGEFLLGALFALSFCPVSAALFFGSLIPLALESSVPWAPVVFYGLGTALPVGIIALVVVFSTQHASALLGGLQKVQPKILQTTAMLLILIGLWLSISSFLQF